ncbi:hypothetical protein BUALT_Bualt11G0060100 [Buddleja alternifolia]|uniref:CCHC-type domain-containing protein n=1 Tax=Buddleja alternifolia TaxID=168488 RepID=A0AAV6X0X6_9LAMI|nr:hypothetical protein BUALT_Bualt11G0060100 [Buddleja alternifolia]
MKALLGACDVWKPVGSSVEVGDAATLKIKRLPLSSIKVWMTRCSRKLLMPPPPSKLGKFSKPLLKELIKRGHGSGKDGYTPSNKEEMSQNFNEGRGRVRGQGRNWKRNLRRYDKSSIKCYNCHNHGHFAWECKNDVKKKNNFSESNTERDPTMLLACKSLEHKDKNQRYLNSGASSHICGKRNIFMELDESICGNITFGDSSQVQVKGKGTILIRLRDGSHHFISNVFYEPEMKSNILSLGKLLEKIYDIHLKNKSLMMKDENGRLLPKVPMTRNKMFMLNIQSDVPR